MEYELSLEAWKSNLHGRVILPKGATPLTVHALREKLNTIWKGLGRWGVTSLGKGYYEFSFTSIEDAKSVRSIASWDLILGYSNFLLGARTLCWSIWEDIIHARGG